MPKSPAVCNVQCETCVEELEEGRNGRNGQGNIPALFVDRSTSVSVGCSMIILAKIPARLDCSRRPVIQPPPEPVAVSRMCCRIPSSTRRTFFLCAGPASARDSTKPGKETQIAWIRSSYSLPEKASGCYHAAVSALSVASKRACLWPRVTHNQRGTVAVRKAHLDHLLCRR